MELTRIELDLKSAPKLENLACPSIVTSEAEIQTSPSSNGLAGASEGLAVPNAEPISIDVLRSKLDRAIIAEEWGAVKAIHERIGQAQQDAAGNVRRLDRTRSGRPGP